VATTKITKRIVDAAAPKTRLEGGPATGVAYIFDTEVRGFGLRVTPAGHRVYIVQYRVGGGRRGLKRRYVIGPHGSPWTPDTARNEARRILGEVAAGRDPAAARHTDRYAITVAELCRRYLTAAEKGLINGKRGKPKKASTLATDRGRIERHIRPLLGSRKVIDLTPADCAKFLRDVAAGKTAADIRRPPGDGAAPAEMTGGPVAGEAVTYSETIRRRGRVIVRGGRGTATRTMGLLGGMLTFAVSEGIRTDNPVREVERYAYRKRKVVLTPEQYRALGTALAEAEHDGENPKAVSAVWLIALTGCRRDEVVGLRRDEVDAMGHCFRLVDSKEGEGIRPVGAYALKVIERQPIEEDNEYVFPGDRNRKHFKGLPKAWVRIRDRVEGLRSLTLHGLRHAFASVANELGYTEATRAALLGHTGTGSQTGDYTHHLDNVLVAAADRVSSVIFARMTGAQAEVVSLPSRVA
jgi:integrase